MYPTFFIPIHVKNFWQRCECVCEFWKTHAQNAHVRVRVRLEFWQNAQVRAMCVRPKIECANVRACEAKNRRNSQIEFITYLVPILESRIMFPLNKQ